MAHLQNLKPVSLRISHLAFFLLPLLFQGCKTRAAKPSEVMASSQGQSCPGGNFVRQWEQDPAIVEITDPAVALYVMADVHGDIKSLAKTLRQLELVDFPEDHWSEVKWTAPRNEKRVLVFLGDLIDKGDGSLEVIQFVQTLEKLAPLTGGRVIALAGNHEIGFLANPYNKKAESLRKEAKDRGLDLCADVYAPDSAFGSWLRRRPAAVIVNGIFMSHSGWAASQDRAGIASEFRSAVDTGQWDSPFTCGDHQARPMTPGFFNAEIWWGKHGKAFYQQLEKLKVQEVLFGHDPGAYEGHGKPMGFFKDADKGSRGLIKLDVGMSEGMGKPTLFLCKTWRVEGGCDEPEVFIRENKDSGPSNVEKLKVSKEDGPYPGEVPKPRDDC